MDGKKKYNTKQRDEIMNCIKEMGNAHFTAADVISKLSEEKNAGQATVYRMLDKMVENGELRKYIVDGSTAACFQLPDRENTVECRSHFHLKCLKCGKLLHVDCSHLDKLSLHIAENHGFRIDNSKTVLYGECEECRRIKD